MGYSKCLGKTGTNQASTEHFGDVLSSLQKPTVQALSSGERTQVSTLKYTIHLQFYLIPFSAIS